MEYSRIRDNFITKYQKELLTKKEAASELRISESTIDRLRKSEVIQCKFIGGKVFFTIDSIANYICSK